MKPNPKTQSAVGANRPCAGVRKAAAIAVAALCATCATHAHAAGTTYTLYAGGADSTWSGGAWLFDTPINNPGDIATFVSSLNRTVTLDTNVTIGQLYNQSSSIWNLKQITDGANAITLDNTGGVTNPLSGSNAFIGVLGAGNITATGFNFVLAGDVDVAVTSSGMFDMASGGITGTGNLYLKSTGSGQVLLRGVNHTGQIVNSSTGTGTQQIASVGANVTSVVHDSTTSLSFFSGSNANFAGSAYIKTGTARVTGAALGTGAIKLGDSANGTDTTLIASGTMSNAITVAGGNGTRTLMTPEANNTPLAYSGPITLEDHDLTIKLGRANSTVRLTGSITGKGNLYLENIAAGDGAPHGGTWNIDGRIINTGSTVASAGQWVRMNGAIGANVKQIVQENPGTPLILSGTNTNFAGSLLVHAGVYHSGSTTALNSKNRVIINTGAKFDLATTPTAGSSYAVTIAGLDDGESGGGAVLNTNTNQTSRSIALGGTGNYSFSGVITATDLAKIGVSKTGSGIQILSGDNTYTGSTSVTGGKLIINGSLANTTVTVSGSGATLGGSGSIAGNTTIGSSGTLAPGNSAGTLTFGGNLTLNNGSTVNFEAGDLVAVAGTLALNNNWTLALSGDFQDGGETLLFTYGGIGLTPDLVPTFSLSGLAFTPSSSLSLIDDGEGRVLLQGLSVVPEPGALTLLAGVVGLALRRRRSA